MLTLKLTRGFKPMNENTGRAVLVLGVAALALSIGAINGAALTASAFDGVKNYAATLLTSTFVQFIALALMVIGVWQAKSGRGWQVLEGLLAVLVLAFVVPPAFVAAATATRSEAEVLRADALFSQAAATTQQALLPGATLRVQR